MTPRRPIPPHLLEAREKAKRTSLALQAELHRLAEMGNPEFADLARRMDEAADEWQRITAEIIDAVSATHH